MALNAEAVLQNTIVSPPTQELTTARGQVLTSTPQPKEGLSTAKQRQLAEARAKKALKKQEEEQKRLALQEELSTVKELLQKKRKADDIASSSSSEEESSSSEESGEEEEVQEPVVKKRKLNVIPVSRTTPTIEFESAPPVGTRSVWAKIGGLFVIAAANAVVSAMGGFNRPAVPNGQKQPAINAYSTLFG